jgi:hypothetical protein
MKEIHTHIEEKSTWHSPSFVWVAWSAALMGVPAALSLLTQNNDFGFTAVRFLMGVPAFLLALRGIFVASPFKRHDLYLSLSALLASAVYLVYCYQHICCLLWGRIG